jgi:hypothetical protein
MNTPHTGACLCGDIQYTVAGELNRIIACHCVNCRKISGAGCSHNLVVKTDQLQVTRGEPQVYADTAASGNRLYRHFCGRCGSSLFSRRAAMPEITVLKAGSLDDASGAQLAMNIWTDSALPWMAIDPAIEHHAQNRPVPQASASSPKAADSK